MADVDLVRSSVRDLNAALHRLAADSNETRWRVRNPRGQHSVAVGLEAPVVVEIDGHVGYYCAGMNKQATVIVNGNAGQGNKDFLEVHGAIFAGPAGRPAAGTA